MYIPNLVLNSYSELDFDKLYEDGYRIIISDLDNTLASYEEHEPSEQLKLFIKNIQAKGFKFYLVSNNKEKRIKYFNDTLNTDGYLYKAGKPGIKKLVEFLKDVDINQVIGLGDQLVTDMLAFNRLQVYSVLIKTIDLRTQKWYTKINRLREKRIINKIKKQNLEIGVQIEKLYE